MLDTPAAILRRKLSQALSRQQLDEAAEILELLRQREAFSLETRVLELEYHVRARHAAEARALVEELRSSNAASPRVQYWSGRYFYSERRYHDALDCFEESERLGRHWTATRYRGKTLTQLGRLEEAESLLLPLVEVHPEALFDVAWLHERKGNLGRALETAERLLAREPESPLARDLVTRLRLKQLDPQALEEELASRAAVGEELPPAMVAQQIAGLLARGQGKEARELLGTHRPRLTGRPALSLAWDCYKLHAFDLAFELFKQSLEAHGSDAKLLSALEYSGKRCDRIGEVFSAYKQHAGSYPQLYGRMRRLARSLPPRADEADPGAGETTERG